MFSTLVESNGEPFKLIKEGKPYPALLVFFYFSFTPPVFLPCHLYCFCCHLCPPCSVLPLYFLTAPSASSSVPHTFTHCFSPVNPPTAASCLLLLSCLSSPSFAGITSVAQKFSCQDRDFPLGSQRN